MNPSAPDVVQQQLEAYNARDLAGFTKLFAETVEVFRLPAATPSLAGKAQFAEFYATQRFNRVALKAELLNRMVLGNKVIDHERIYGVQDNPFEIVVVFEVRNGLIQTLWTYSTE